MSGENCVKGFRVFLPDPCSQIWHWANLRLANRHVKSTSMLSADVSSGLHEELETLALKNKARAIGVALHDLETGFRFSLRGDRWFHAASTIKVAVLLAVFRAADQGRFRLDDSLHVRNQRHVGDDAERRKPLFQRSGWIALSSQPGSRRHTGAI